MEIQSLSPSTIANTNDSWRLTHLGRLLGQAMRRFDARVLWLMARNVEVPLALANLAARNQVGAAHIHITRHLAVTGSRLTDLASSAAMSKQAMAELVDQCEAWGLVTREVDPHDKRARQVRFTAIGQLWLQAFQRAVEQAEEEFCQAVGQDVATVVKLGLEAYAGAQD
jgi:DNA-binding MarR family transcriptional regulator